MGKDILKVALITDVFPGDDAEERLMERLSEARSREASLAVLPELPLNGWSPATRTAREEDAEPPGGQRHEIQARSARQAGLGLVGGAIILDPGSGKRFNTSLIFGPDGRLWSSYRKLHLPEEEGYWETSHYEPGDDPPSLVTGFPLALGIQICSDVNRPEGSHILGALGAEAILAPRCTPLASYERWKLVFRANALTSAAYVISTNRPRPEGGVPIGGASLAVAPDGEVLVETVDPVSVVTLEGDRVRRAREDYPGYLPVRADLYARAWRRIPGE